MSSCFVATAAICLFSPDNVYIEGEFDYALNRENIHSGDWRWDSRHHFQYWEQTQAPYRHTGRLELGWTIDITDSFKVSAGLFHSSLWNYSDEGHEGITVKATWFPWRD